MDHPLVVDMVEKALYVDGEEGRDQAVLSGGVNVVDEGESCVKAGSIGSATKLVEGHEIEFACIEEKSFGDYLFHKFAHAFDKLDGAV